MTERVIVTGGAGFIGSHIVDAFVAAGHTVAVVDNLSTGKLQNLNPAAAFYQADIRDVAALAVVFAQELPTVVCHQAALADVRGSLRDPAGYAQVNVIGTLNLLEAARNAGTVRKFLFASTGGAVYGEGFIDTYRHNYGLSYAILRYANVYGPRQDPFGEAGVVAIFAGGMLAGRPLTVNGDGLQQRDFVYVGDVARANLAALSGDESGIYNIGTGVPTDVRTIWRELARITKYPGAEQHGPAKLGEVRTTYLDIACAARELSWQPTVTLAEGLARTVDFFRGTALK